MSELIDTVQLQETGEALIDLFEIEIRGETIYLYGGLDDTNAEVIFDSNTYMVFPIEVEGLDWTSDGAAARPTLRAANIMSLITTMNLGTDPNGQWTNDDFLGITKNEDLVGARVTRRRTLVKHLNQGGSPVEFPKQVFILDRVSSENNVTVEYELASPFDVEGVQIPSRVVIGKYCPWKYQGATEAEPCGGCVWPQNSRGLYFDINDDPITGYDPTWAIGTPYVAAAKVKHGNFIYRCVRDNTGQDPSKSPAYWTRIDLCGKTISSCKVRFQDTATNAPLPFGGFPGSKKFK